jgi:hypothetical protein
MYDGEYTTCHLKSSNTRNSYNLIDVLAANNNSQFSNFKNYFSNNQCSKTVSLAILNKFSNHFNFFHANVQGILEGAHLDQLKNLICNNDSLSLIAISETFLRHSNTNKSVEIENFKIIRSDRIGNKNDRNKGGGVAIYLHKNFKYKILLNSNKDNLNINFIDFIFIEIFTKTIKIVFGVIYRTNNCSNSDSRKFFDFLANTMSNEQNVILTGDFNINFLNDNLNINLMNNFAINFQLVNDECPTHHWPGKASSKIDLIFTNNPKYVLHFGHFPSGISFHDIVLCSFKVKSDNINHNFVMTTRNYNKVNKDYLLSHLKTLNWNFSTFNNVNHIVDLLTNNILNLLDRFAPLKTYKVKHPPKNWFNNEIKPAMSDRKTAYDNWKNSSFLDNNEILTLKNNYKNQNKIVKKLIDKSKKEKFAKDFSNVNSNKAKWNLIASYGCTKEINNDDVDILNNFDLNDLNQFFASIHYSNGACLDSLNIINQSNVEFNFTDVDLEDFLRAFNKIKSNAIGEDGISMKFLKLIINDIADSILYAFNYCIRNNVYPSKWNSIIIRPLNKITNPQQVSDFRPISIVCVLAKIFAIIINEQIINFLESNLLLHSHQSGFRRDYSCSTALLKISESIRSSLSKKKLVFFVSLDIKSAFPSVPHDALFKTCQLFGFSDSAVSLIKGLYGNINQKVKVSNEFSETININNGVLQGRNFDQTLFSLYFNDILSVTKYLTGFLFADDYQAIYEFEESDIENAIHLVNLDLSVINDWNRNRGLKLNTAKSKVMIIGTKNQTNKLDLENIPKIRIGNDNLEYCSTIKNLGVIFDQNMTFEAHNNSKLQNIYGCLNKIRHTKQFIPNYIKRDIATAIIDPLFNYGDVITYGWNVHGTISDEHRLLIADNDKIRYIYNLKRHDHISEYREKLQALKPDEKSRIHCATLIYNQLHRNRPEYLNSLFVPNISDTRSNGDLKIFKPRTEFDKRSFCYSANMFWNSIPDDITKSETTSKFKKELKYWMKSNID